jgi:arsenite-transporting ATPase
VLVNGLIQKEKVDANTAEFVLNRIKMQDEHMLEIEKIFGDRVRAIAPLFESEVKGVPMLKRLMDSFFPPA